MGLKAKIKVKMADEIENKNEVENTEAVSKRKLPSEESPESCSSISKKAKLDPLESSKNADIKEVPGQARMEEDDEEGVVMTDAKDEEVNEDGKELGVKTASPASFGQCNVM